MTTPHAAYPGTEDGARMIMRALRTDATFVRSLRPTPEDYAAIFEGDAAAIAQAAYDAAWDGDQIRVEADPAQVDVEVSRVTTEELRAGTGRAAEFPGGYARIATQLRPNLAFYLWRYLAPGAEHGMRYDGLVHVNGRWVWVPKPFRALR